MPARRTAAAGAARVPEAHWPTADEAARSRLFSPSPRPVTATTRTWVPAMVPWRATDDGFVTPRRARLVRPLRRRAPGVLVVEATGIRDVPSGPAAAHRPRPLRRRPARPGRTVRERAAAAARGCSCSSSTSSSIRRRPSGEVLRALPAVTDAPPRRRCANASAPWRSPTRRVREHARRAATTTRCARAHTARVDRDSRSATASASPTCTCRTCASCRACCRPVRRRRRARARGRLRRRRAALRARLHDGVVPVADERARPTATAARRRLACGCRSR
jgi:hypothetical protein